MKMLMKKGRLNQIKISANVIAPVKKKSCYKEVMVPTKARTIYRSRLLNTIQAIIISAFLLVYPLTACANEVPPPAIPDRLPSDIFILNDMRWVEEIRWGGNNWEHIYDPETGKMIALTNNRHTAIIMTSTRLINENSAELYSKSEVTRTDFGWTFSAENGEGEYFERDSTYTTPNVPTGSIITIENNRVYVQSTDDKEGKYIRLLYDFNLNVGDAFMLMHIAEPYNKILLTSIDSVLLLNGEYKKRYNFGNEKIYQGQKYYDYSVIEGIGCDIYLFYPLTINSNEDHHNPVTLKAVYYKDRLIWSSELYWQGGI
ncbi:MAG: hypothetical protein FWG85_05255 [Bacteroidetes bacterium]|nr:hypothetical protein [Bacteroidota bacterium]